MAVKEIVQDGDPVLRKVAPEVPLDSIPSKDIQNLIEDMRDALAECSDGVGLAAPQIGVSKRIFIVSQHIFAPEGEEYTPKPALVFINPELEKLSKDTSVLEEGCLSVRGKYGYIKRADKARVRAYDENGKAFTYNGTGLLAEIFQHEVDHLNGILYIDSATDIHDGPLGASRKQ